MSCQVTSYRVRLHAPVRPSFCLLNTVPCPPYPISLPFPSFPFLPPPSSDQLPVSTKFDMRSDPGVVRNYGRLLVDMAAAVPDGIVCFFVSYSYMDSIVNAWHEMGVLKVR